MTPVLLDTSAFSAFMRGHPGALRVVREADVLALSAVSVGELLAGFRRGSRRAKNEAELARFLESPRVRVLSVSADTAERYAAVLDGLLRAGTPIPTNDLWIAACAMEHGCRVVTADRHFEKVPQVLVELLLPDP